MKYIITPVNKQDLKKYIVKPNVEHVLVGVKFLTHGIGLKLDAKELNVLIKKTNKISLEMTRLFHEDELSLVKEILNELELERVNLIFYSDFAIYLLLKEKGLEKKAVYNAYTYTTNASDVNIYNELNKYVCISNQISVDEIKQLLENVNKKAIVYGFGKSIIFYSRRPLLTNYFKYRKLDDNPYAKNYYLKEEFRDDFYHIFEDEFGSYIYEAGYYYLFEELNELKNIEYVILSSADLSSKLYEKVVDAYLENDLNALKAIEIKLYKGIMQERSVLLKSEVMPHE